MAKCPECGSDLTRDTATGSGVMTSTYVRLTHRYECRSCGHHFTATRKFDKTDVNLASERSLQQMESGNMNTYSSVDQILGPDA